MEIECPECGLISTISGDFTYAGSNHIHCAGCDEVYTISWNVRLTPEEIEELERHHNVWIDVDNQGRLIYNTNFHAETGWQVVPEEWLEDLR